MRAHEGGGLRADVLMWVPVFIRIGARRPKRLAGFQDLTSIIAEQPQTDFVVYTPLAEED